MATQIKKTSTIKKATTVATRNNYPTNTISQTSSLMMMTRQSAAPLEENSNIRSTINITIDSFGHLIYDGDEVIDLGVWGDNKVTTIIFNTSLLQSSDGGIITDYNARLFIYNKQYPLGGGNPKVVEPDTDGFTNEATTFTLQQSWFECAGTYEFIYALIESNEEEGNIENAEEVFISNVLIGKVNDTEIPSNFELLISNAETQDHQNIVNQYLQKPNIEIIVSNNIVSLDSEANLNKFDAFTTLLYFTQTVNEQHSFNSSYLVYTTPLTNGALKLMLGPVNNYFVFIPPEWTAAAGDVNVWLVCKNDDETTYVGNKLSFKVNDNFLSANDFEQSIYDSENNVIQDNTGLPLVTPVNIGGYHKIQYTGDKLDSLLDYINQLQAEDVLSILDTNGNDISTLKTNVNAINEDVANLHDIFNDQAGMINSINTDLADITQTVNNHQEELNALDGDLSQAIERINANEEDVDKIYEDLSNMTATVECVHSCEITGNTGDEHGLAIEDQQMLIPKIQGQSLVVNQLIDVNEVYYEDNNGITFTISDGKVIANGTPTTEASISYFVDTIIGHKYLLAGCSQGGDKEKYYTILQTAGSYHREYGEGIIFEQNDEGSQIFYCVNETVNNLVFTPQLIDLTQMFGAGNEPTTVEEFYSKYGGGYIPYTEGTFKHSNCELISTGRNLWDEEWEIGYFDASGNPGAYDNAIRSKNYIPVIPNTIYYVKGENIVITKYDINKKPLGYILWGASDSGFVIPADTYYIRIAKQNVKTYNNDICINISDVSFNGTYEPYKEEIISNIGELKTFDFVDNRGNKKTLATSNEIDLGTLTWVPSKTTIGGVEYPLFYSSLKDKKDGRDNIRTIGVPTTQLYFNNAPDHSVLGNSSGKELYYINRELSTGEQAQERLSGCKIIYELAAPVEEDIILPSGYAVYKNGYQVQDGEVPYILTKEYSLSTKAQILANIEIDREQQKQIDNLNDSIEDANKEIDDIQQDLSVVVIEPIPDNWVLKTLSSNNLSDPTKPTYHYIMSIDGEPIGDLNYKPKSNNNYGGWSLGGGPSMDLIFSYDINTAVLTYISDGEATLSHWAGGAEDDDDALPIITKQNIKPQDIYTELQGVKSELQEVKSEIDTVPVIIAIPVEFMIQYDFYRYYRSYIDYSYYNTTIEKGLAEFEFIAESGLQIKCRGYISNLVSFENDYKFDFDVKYMSINDDTNSEFAMLGSCTVYICNGETGFGPWMAETVIGWKPINSLENPSYKENYLVLGHPLLLE